MKQYKNLSRLICCLLCLCLCLSACRRQSDSTTTANQGNPRDIIYTVTLKTAGSMVLKNVAVYVYGSDTEENLLTYGNLDNNGAFTFTAPESDQYTVRFAGLPKEGYDVQPYYPITSHNTDIVLTSSVVTGKDALEAGKTYELGDVMRDFTVTTVDGEKLTLSKILEEKQAVVLNFWYTGCGDCREEAPLLQTAYADYRDRIEVIAMNPTDLSRDTVDDIKAYRDQNNLAMPMATCSGQWFSVLGINRYPTTVVIDRYGVVCMVAGNVNEPGVFESVFQHFTAEAYEQKLVEDILELHTVEYPEGHPRNPYQTHGAVERFAVTVPAQSEYYVQIYKADGITLRIEDPNAYVRYGDTCYNPDDNGVIEVKIDNADVMTVANVIIGNSGATDAVIEVRLLVPQGTSSNPYGAQLGNITVQIPAGNDQGVCYSWIASEAGVLTLTVTGAPRNEFDVQLYNIGTMAVRNLSEEVLEDENGNRYVSVEVNAGDEVRIAYMSAPDASGNYPATTIQAELSFVKAEALMTEYCVTIVDDSGNPMENVTVCVMVGGVEIPYYSDAEGKVTMSLPSGTYTMKLTVPEGYTCAVTQFLLSPNNPARELVLAAFVPQPVVYTVYVVDETGAPVANATVILANTTYYTDANGVVTFELVESDNYAFLVMAPEGYKLENSVFAFGTETSITVTVYHNAEEPENIEYKVYVVDQNRKPVTDVQVRLDAENGAVNATAVVDAKGCATFMLPAANYVATVLFNGGTTMGYEPTITKLTPYNTELTMELVPMVASEGETIYPGGKAYQAAHVSEGSFYVDLKNADIRFFIFTPENAGMYVITTTNPDAALSYWNTPTSLKEDAAAVMDNVCTIEVKSVGDSFVLAIRGGTNISGTVLKIIRIGGFGANAGTGNHAPAETAASREVLGICAHRMFPRCTLQ